MVIFKNFIISEFLKVNSIMDYHNKHLTKNFLKSIQITIYYTIGIGSEICTLVLIVKKGAKTINPTYLDFFEEV